MEPGHFTPREVARDSEVQTIDLRPGLLSGAVSVEVVTETDDSATPSEPAPPPKPDYGQRHGRFSNL